MEINKKAPLTARKEFFIQATPAVVWQKLAGLDSWSQWHPGVDALTLDGPVAPGTSFALRGGSVTWQATLRVVEPERRIEWTGGMTGARAIHRWEITPQGTGALLMTEESLEGWLAWVFKLVKPKFLDETLVGSLEAVKKAAEGDVED